MILVSTPNSIKFQGLFHLHVQNENNLIWTQSRRRRLFLIKSRRLFIKKSKYGNTCIREMGLFLSNCNHYGLKKNVPESLKRDARVHRQYPGVSDHQSKPFGILRKSCVRVFPWREKIVRQ